MMDAGLYIHIPYCSKKCHYCNFYSEPLADSDPEKLLGCIVKEIKNRLKGTVDTIYIGGGSPSALGFGLVEFIEKLLKITGQVKEFTVEVNPQQADKKLLKALRNLSVDRISIGAQSFNNDELEFLSRPYTDKTIFKAVKNAQKAGFDNISLDLIYAIPGQTISSWCDSLKTVANMDITHISAYSLSFEQGTLLNEMLKSGQFQQIEEEIDRIMYDDAVDILAEAGFERYEISNFSLPGRNCRHNLKYWYNYDYLGIGPAAGSFYQGLRTINYADIDKYIDLINAGSSVFAQSSKPDKIEFACETMVLGLRKIQGIDLSWFYYRTGFDAMVLFEDYIRQYQSQGLLLVEPNHIRFTPKAIAIADSILADFSSV